MTSTLPFPDLVVRQHIKYLCQGTKLKLKKQLWKFTRDIGMPPHVNDQLMVGGETTHCFKDKPHSVSGIAKYE